MTDTRVSLMLTPREIAQLETALVALALSQDRQAVEARRWQLATLAEIYEEDAAKSRALKTAIVAAYAEVA
jgi:hypothetical protein